VTSTLNLLRNGAVGFIDWLDPDQPSLVPLHATSSKRINQAHGAIIQREFPASVTRAEIFYRIAAAFM
jgi:hypothetical protein